MPIFHRSALSLAVLAGALGLSACGDDPAHSVAPSTARGPSSEQPTPVPREAAAKPDDTRVRAFVKSTMDVQYTGGYDAAHRCWKTTVGEGNEAMNYCMRPQPPHVVATASGVEVYFHAASASDINDDQDYAYASVDEGLMGAFRASFDGTHFEMLSSAPTMPSGLVGDCGCTRARFDKVSNDLYAWSYSQGGTWQGTTSSVLVVVAPLGKTFGDIATIPDVPEADQNVSHRFAFLPTPADGFYPLQIVRLRSGKEEKRVTVAFDETAQRYSVPSDI